MLWLIVLTTWLLVAAVVGPLIGRMIRVADLREQAANRP